MCLLDEFSEKGYLIINLPKSSFINQIINIIKIEKDKLEKIENTDVFHSKLELLQKRINDIGARKYLVSDMKNILLKLFNKNLIAAQNVVYLRGVRPINKQNIKVEYLPMHRENFYCENYIDSQINVHFPILNYNDKTAMKFIDGSHNFPDKNIIFKKEDSNYSGVKRYSKGHKLGLPYNPKIIQNLEDIGKPIRTLCRPGQVMLFSTKLIHGGGFNESNNIRYSLDFGILPIHLINLQKRNHFANYDDNSCHYSMLSIS